MKKSPVSKAFRVLVIHSTVKDPRPIVLDKIELPRIRLTKQNRRLNTVQNYFNMRFINRRSAKSP